MKALCLLGPLSSRFTTALQDLPHTDGKSEALKG